MSDRSRGKATLAESMVLVFGAALSLACWRYFSQVSAPPRGSSEWPPWIAYHARGMVFLVIPMSLTLLVLAMPRTPRRRLARHPAAVVGLSILPILVLHIAIAFTALIRQAQVSPLMEDMRVTNMVMAHCGLIAREMASTLAAMIFVQWVGGRLRMPKDWLEVSGWALGLCWVAACLGPQIASLL